MLEVVLDLRNLSVPALISRLRAIHTATSQAAVFSSALATELATLDAKTTVLEQKQSELRKAEGKVTTATLERDEKEKDAIAAVNDLARGVGETATTEAQVESALMRVKSQPAPKPVPDQPTGLELSVGDEESELSGQCNGQPGVVEYYEIQITTSDPNGSNPNWQHFDTSKKSRFDMPGLPSGQKVWVRLRGCNARGKSPWSDPACKRVP